MEANIKCPYTKEMLDSENKFLGNIEQFCKPQEQINFKENTCDSISISNLVSLTLGKNKGEKVPLELKNRLEEGISAKIKKMNLTKSDYEADVIIVRKWWSRFMCSNRISGKWCTYFNFNKRKILPIKHNFSTRRNPSCNRAR